MDYLNGVSSWLNLALCNYVLSTFSIIFGIFFCIANYQSKRRSVRNTLQCLVCVIVFGLGGLFIFTIIFPGSYNLFWGLISLGGGAFAGLIYFYIFNYRGSVFFFTTAVGILSGATFANQLMCCYLFELEINGNPDYVLIIVYAVCSGIFFLIAHFFHYNAFNILISWCGSFFFIRGSIFLTLANQSSMIKKFLYHHDFKDDEDGGVLWTKQDDPEFINPNKVKMDLLLPVYIFIIEVFVFLLSVCLKKYFERQ